MNHIYVMYYDNPEPVFIYVGTTSRSVEARWKEHQAGINDLQNHKDLYVYIRQNNLQDRVCVELVESVADFDKVEIWEDQWIVELINEGYPLQNAVRGHKKIAKKPREVTPKSMLEEAEKSYERNKIIEEWYEYKNGESKLISKPAKDDQQALNKSEQLRQDITDSAPTLEDIQQAPWKPIDQHWYQMKWGKYTFQRRRFSKKRAKIMVINTKSDRYLELDRVQGCFCDDILYMWVIDNWLDNRRIDERGTLVDYDEKGWFITQWRNRKR